MSQLTFVDNQKRQWSLRITIADARRLKESGIDLCNPEAFKVLFANALSQIELIAELMRPQWMAAGMQYEEFADFLIDQEGRFEEVLECFLNALSDFFHRLREPHLAKLAEKAREAAEKTIQAQVARISSPRMDAMIDQMIEADERRFEKAVAGELQKLSGGMSTSAKES